MSGADRFSFVAGGHNDVMSNLEYLDFRMLASVFHSEDQRQQLFEEARRALESLLDEIPGDVRDVFIENAPREIPLYALSAMAITRPTSVKGEMMSTFPQPQNFSGTLQVPLPTFHGIGFRHSPEQVFSGQSDFQRVFKHELGHLLALPALNPNLPPTEAFIMGCEDECKAPDGRALDPDSLQYTGGICPSGIGLTDIKTHRCSTLRQARYHMAPIAFAHTDKADVYRILARLVDIAITNRYMPTLDDMIDATRSRLDLVADDVLDNPCFRVFTEGDHAAICRTADASEARIFCYNLASKNDFDPGSGNYVEIVARDRDEGCETSFWQGDRLVMQRPPDDDKPILLPFPVQGSLRAKFGDIVEDDLQEQTGIDGIGIRIPGIPEETRLVPKSA